MIVGGNQTFQPYQEKTNPFPSLDPIFGAAFPLYDFAENLQANEDIFKEKFDYVSWSQHTMTNYIIAFSSLAGVFLVLGIVTIVLYKMCDPSRTQDEHQAMIDQLDLDDSRGSPTRKGNIADSHSLPSIR